MLELRPELMPPELDEAEVARLGKLAGWIDGANPGQWEDHLEEFNRAAGTSLTFYDFQGIYGAEEHETWVRRVLIRRRLRPVPDVTRAELVEIVRRAMPSNGDPQYEAFMAILDANVPWPGASNLIFSPLTTTWPRTPGAVADRWANTTPRRSRSSIGRCRTSRPRTRRRRVSEHDRAAASPRLWLGRPWPLSPLIRQPEFDRPIISGGR